MEVMIAVPLVVPDAPLGVRTLEELVEAWGRQVMRQAMAAAWAAQATLRPGAVSGLRRAGEPPGGHQSRKSRGLRPGGVAAATPALRGLWPALAAG